MARRIQRAEHTLAHFVGGFARKGNSHHFFRVRGLRQQHQIALGEQLRFSRTGRGLHDERGLRIKRLLAGGGVGNGMAVSIHLRYTLALFS